MNIHVNNIAYLHCNTRDKKSSKDGVRKSDIESDSGPSILKETSLRHSIHNTSNTCTPEDLHTDEFLDKLLIPLGKNTVLQTYYYSSNTTILLLPSASGTLCLLCCPVRYSARANGDRKAVPEGENTNMFST